MAKAWLAVLVLAAAAAAQQQQQQVQQERVAGAPDAATPRPALSPAQVRQNQERARRLLEAAQAQAAGFEAPMRAFSLWQIGESLAPMDRARAVTALRDAFTATLAMDEGESGDAGRAQRDDKGRLQESILRALLTLDQATVEELLPQAMPAYRRSIEEEIIRRAVKAKQFDRALDLLYRSAREGDEFPYDAATQYLLALPPERAADRLNVFTQAFSSYQQHEAKSIRIGGGTFEQMIVRFSPDLPPRTVLAAIDEALKQAKARDEEAQMSLSSAAGSVSFNSFYEYTLFQFLPILRRLDESTAERLLRENTQLQPVLAQYPNGVQSLDPTIRNTPVQPGENSGMSMSVSTGSKSRGGSARLPGQQLIAQYQAEMERIVRAAPDNPRQAIAQAAALPEEVSGAHLRGQALQQIARVVWKKDPAAARDALDELVKLTERYPGFSRSQTLASVAEMYLNLGETDAARKAIEQGAKAAQALYEKDTDRSDPNLAIKGYWPSTVAWRLFIVQAERIAARDALAIIAGIKDEEVRTAEQIAYAGLLAGRAMRSATVVQRTKSGQNMETFSEE